MTVHHLDIDAITLKKGSHARRGKTSVCVMEAVAWWAEEPHSDRPTCVSPVIAAFLRKWNDDLDDATRQRLKPYIAKVVGTNTGAADDQRRVWLVTDWMVRTYLPAWLDLAGMTDQGAAVRALPPLTEPLDWEVARPTVDAAENAAWSAARSAAESAARNAAWSAAENAAWSAAENAAWSAAENAAWSAARRAAWSAARSAAWSAAWSAARNAAWSAARNAAWSAAESAAWSALRPTTESLQESAFGLLDAMCAVGREVPA